MAIHNQLGKWGEDVAADFLQQKGYRIVARNWKYGKRDLDIVATEGDTLVVVEVKTRSGNILIQPEMAVDYAKLMSLRKAANAFVKARLIDATIRFDVVSISVQTAQQYKIVHYQDISMY